MPAGVVVVVKVLRYNLFSIIILSPFHFETGFFINTATDFHFLITYYSVGIELNFSLMCL